ASKASNSSPSRRCNAADGSPLLSPSCSESPGEAHRHEVTAEIVQLDVGVTAVIEILYARGERNDECKILCHADEVDGLVIAAPDGAGGACRMQRIDVVVKSPVVIEVVAKSHIPRKRILEPGQ